MEIKRFFSVLLVGLGIMACPLNFGVSAKDINLDNVTHETIVDMPKDNNFKCEEQKKCETVYVTKNGKRYHKENCSCLKKSKIAISKDDAEKNNYTICSKCFKSGKEELTERSKCE